MTYQVRPEEKEKWQKTVWVFSTYVEVILTAWFFESSQTSILHVCGGDP